MAGNDFACFFYSNVYFHFNSVEYDELSRTCNGSKVEDTPFCLSLDIRPSCQTSNALEISWKTAQISRDLRLSNDL